MFPTIKEDTPLQDLRISNRKHTGLPQLIFFWCDNRCMTNLCFYFFWAEIPIDVPQISLKYVSPLSKNVGALGFWASMYLCNPARILWIVLGGVRLSLFVSNFDNKTWNPIVQFIDIRILQKILWTLALVFLCALSIPGTLPFLKTTHGPTGNIWWN